MKCRQAFPSKLQRHRASCKIGQRRQRGLFPTVSLFNGNYCCRYFSDPISQYFTRVDNTEWNKRQPGGPGFPAWLTKYFLHFQKYFCHFIEKITSTFKSISVISKKYFLHFQKYFCHLIKKYFLHFKSISVI